MLLLWLLIIALKPFTGFGASDSQSIRIRPGKKPKASTQAQPTEASAWKPCFWKISGKGIEPGYLLGTIHLPTPATLKLPPEVQHAFDKAAAVYCEIAFEPEAQQKVAAAISKASTPLTELLPRDLANRCEKALQRIDSSLHVKDFDGMELWALSIQLVVLEDHFKNPDFPPLDPRLYHLARASGKKVGGLETVEEQTSAMQHSTEDQIALLQATLDEMEAASKFGHSVSKPLLDAFLAGDVEALQSFYERTLNRYPPKLRDSFSKTLLTDRNRTLVQRISKTLLKEPSQSHFFAVGAMHAIGTESLPKLLEQNGFTVERVESTNPAAKPKR